MNQLFERLPRGELYTTDEYAEMLSATDPSEAISMYVLEAHTDTDDVVAHVRDLAPLKVFAYRRMKMPAGHAERFADVFLESLQDDLGDDGYLGPEGEGFDAVLTHRSELVAVVERMLSAIKVWGCEPIGKIELDADALERWVRQEHPKWVERKDRWRQHE